MHVLSRRSTSAVTEALAPRRKGKPLRGGARSWTVGLPPSGTGAARLAVRKRAGGNGSCRRAQDPESATSRRDLSRGSGESR